ncbi:MAG TPA: hypothetical protein VM370_00555 [Candidatus Thermoplasmatota archaeon]|nr:hypothetical protein [Candidatus Thermoplasmatota archaeon]
MRRRPHPDLVLALAAILAVCLLLGLAHLLDPPLVPFADVKEGSRVAVEARVLELRGRYGVLSDGAHRMPAFLPLRAPPVERGDMVRGEGIVSRGDTGLLLSLDTLVVTQPTAALVRSPADLAAAPDEFEGARVVVAGYVQRDALVGGGARVLMGGDAPSDGYVLVTAVFRYHEPDASFRLWVESWTPSS